MKVKPDFKGKTKMSPKAHMLQCLKSHLDFNGEMNFATQTNENNTYEATADKKKMVKNQDIDYSSTYISPTMSY